MTKPSRRLGVMRRFTRRPARAAAGDGVRTAGSTVHETPMPPKARALVSWIDEHEDARAREKLRDQGRKEVLRALMLGKLQIRDVVTGGRFKIPSPWTDADVEQWGMTREQIADTVAPADSLPPAEDSPLAHLARLNTIREI